jgi:hypothetical protein
MEIKTTGDLRGLLGQTLVGIRDGTIDKSKADAIAKVASQINQSLSVEVNAAISLRKLGDDHPIAGSMKLTSTAKLPKPKKALPTQKEDPLAFKCRTDLVWCEQCDRRQSPEMIGICNSSLCPVKEKGVRP